MGFGFDLLGIIYIMLIISNWLYFNFKFINFWRKKFIGVSIKLCYKVFYKIVFCGKCYFVSYGIYCYFWLIKMKIYGEN